MTRRWYRLARADRRSGTASRSDGTAYVTTSYEQNGRRRHLAAAFVDTQDLDDVAGAISRRAAAVPAGRDASTSTSTPAATAGEDLANAPEARRSSARTSRRSSSASCSTCPRRCAASPAPTRSRCGARVDGGWELDRDLQFVHPELAERLNLWRMSEFALERIPSPADVYLFRGVGRSNPKDERLFALAEVRELSDRARRGGPRRLAARARAHAGRGARARCAASRPAARRASACCGTACG